MGVELRITWRNLSANRKYERARRKIQDFRPECDRIGRFIVHDARRELKVRDSRVSIGRLSRSLKHKAFRTAVMITSVLPYARIQQEGGIIKPRRARALAIPIDAGVARRRIWPRHMKKGEIYRVGNVLMRRYKNKPDRPWWALVKRVKIPARPYLKKTNRLAMYARGVLIDALKRTARGA